MEASESVFSNQPLLLHAAMESSTNGVTIADAAQPDLPLIYINSAFERITGYPRAEVIGRNCRFLHAQERDQEGLDVVRKSLAEGTPCHAILKNFRKDGALFWNELYMSPVRGPSGDITHFVGIQNDVTRRVDAERARLELQNELQEKNARLQELNDTKNEFLGIAAHDLRNPLATIVMSASTLDKEVLGPMTAQQRQLTELIGGSAEFMLRLVNDLLDVSKIEAGKLSLVKEPVDLVALLEQIVEIHAHRAGEKGIAMKLHPPESGSLELGLDAHRFRQVIDNLITNAIKFSPEGASVNIRTGVEHGSAVLAVADTGPGIPTEDLDRLFKPFSKTNVKATGGEKSTGLGLMICRKIVEGHGGTIEVQSQVGRGTTFTVRLPLARTAE